MNIVLWVLQVLLAVMFLMAGAMKTFQYERAKAQMKWVGDVSHGLVTFIGVSELLGGIGLILPALTRILPWLTPMAAVGLAAVMVLPAAFTPHAANTQISPSTLSFSSWQPLWRTGVL